MAALQGLKLISAKRQVQTNPLLYRRSKLVSRIDEQILLAQAAIEQRTYTKQRARSVRAAVEGGELDTQITQASERLREGFKE
ncbi:MAG: hypothetical protein EBX17_11985 [Betaproteobacteria bacterium]|nr:hypothetical protein [Betaproteobacteria bacterium]